MITLDQIVLPLAESKKLSYKGVELDTALGWYCDDEGDYVLPVNNKEMHLAELCPAPTLSELLDAIRAKQPYAVVQCGDRPRGYVGSEKRACSAMQPEGCSDIRYGDTDLLAAYALLLEVAK